MEILEENEIFIELRKELTDTIKFHFVQNGDTLLSVIIENECIDVSQI